MRWRGLRRSSHVEDRRGASTGGRIPVRIGRGGGIGGAGLVLLVIVAYLVGGPELVLNLVGGESAAPPGSTSEVSHSARGDDEAADFARAILGSTEDTWSAIFAAEGERYSPPKLVLFYDVVESACGTQSSATGPFYCPPDRALYLDLSFFEDLARLGGPGDFAQAYVIGHEVGHHIQTLTGTADAIRRQQQGVDARTANRLQVAVELQADCYAGVWANHANRSGTLLEPGDVEEGLAAAAAIGDDRLQRNASRRVSPDSFTHGTSAQRREWLERGLTLGRYAACETTSTR
jgi:predicted metalloprotease